MTIDLRAALAAHPFCSDLNDDELGVLKALAHEDSFAEDDFVFRENDSADHLYLVTAGLIRLELSSPAGLQTIQTLDSDDALGLSWLHGEDGRWLFDARVVEPATVVVIDGEALHAACDADCGLGYKVTRHLLMATTERLQATRMRLLDMYR